MKIGVLGSGEVGKNLALGFLKSGYDVKIGSSNKEKLIEWKNESGPKASIGSFEETSKFGEIIVVAVSGTAVEDVLNLAKKENFRNKIIIDVTNPLEHNEKGPPKLLSAPGHSVGEKIQKWLPESKVAKAFNTVNNKTMTNPGLENEPDLFIAGDEKAKKFVNEIAKKWGWKSIIDIGDISKSYLLEALAMLWIEYGYKYNHWTHTFKFIK